MEHPKPFVYCFSLLQRKAALLIASSQGICLDLIYGSVCRHFSTSSFASTDYLWTIMINIFYLRSIIANSSINPELL